ncbi:hypothetical protein [Propionispora vibrioides]|uniref:Deoxycytidine triphosphate deaminase n=1 Tax=Propionispora vibrioides TaxID=112903 RepID=A0A1H8SIH2_9FIRM|nr:hypothetical protein [Propionispora vibrioides]SEO78550.1 Deoxycytidine triphosphate deaminase [Propionispora vibrioides]
MFSDRDIRKALNKDIVIFPFREDDLTPVGYNFNPTDFVFSLTSQDLVPAIDGFYNIKPHDTVLILTEEAVWVSKKIAGTFHSKVGVVSQGFGHISTTLDPNWHGPLLISLNNPTDLILKLPVNKSFVTLILYKVNTPADKDHDNQASRVDILRNISEDVLDKELTDSNKNFLRKVQTIFIKEDVYDEFKKKYTKLLQDSKASIISGQKTNAINRIFAQGKYYGLKTLQVILFLLCFFRLLALIPACSALETYLFFIDKGVFMGMLAIAISLFMAIKVVKEEVL